MAAERAKKRRRLGLGAGHEQLISIRRQRMPSLLGQDTAGAGQTRKPGWLRRQACSSGSADGWPLAPLGTCEVIRFRTNSPTRFLTAPSLMAAESEKTNSEAPRQEDRQ